MIVLLFMPRIQCFARWAFVLAVLVYHMGETAAWKAEWKRVDPSLTRISPRRSGLVALTFHQNNPTTTVPPLIFGGYAEVDQDEQEGQTSHNNKEKKYRRYVTNDVWEWNRDTLSWHEIPTTGDIPAPRLVGAGVVLESGKKAYLIGGWNSDAKEESDDMMFLDTVHVLDLETRHWTLCKDTVLPDGPASRHVAVALSSQSKILVHTHRCIDFVWLLDTSGNQSDNKDSRDETTKSTPVFVRQPTTGPCPSARGLHAACLLPGDQGKIVFFGGAAQDGTMSADVFVLDTKTWTWTTAFTSSLSDGNHAAPTPRASPCLCAVNEHTVLVFGGAQATQNGLKPHNDAWLFDVESCKWTRLEPTTACIPPPRNGAAMFALPSSSSSSSSLTREYLLTGGWAPFVETWDDCYLLRLSND